MDHQAINEEFELESELYHYHTLRTWLTYEAYGLVIWVAAFFASVDIVAIVAAVAAFAFVPIMIRELIELERPRLIGAWVGMVLIPAVLAYLLAPDQREFYWATIIFLAASYIYFWIMRVKVDSWARQLVHGLEGMRRAEKEAEEYEGI